MVEYINFLINKPVPYFIKKRSRLKVFCYDTLLFSQLMDKLEIFFHTEFSFSPSEILIVVPAVIL